MTRIDGIREKLTEGVVFKRKGIRFVVYKIHLCSEELPPFYETSRIYRVYEYMVMDDLLEIGECTDAEEELYTISDREDCLLQDDIEILEEEGIFEFSQRKVTLTTIRRIVPGEDE